MRNPLIVERAEAPRDAVDIQVNEGEVIHRVTAWESSIADLPAVPMNFAQSWPRNVGAVAAVSPSCRILCIGPRDWLVVGGEWDAAIGKTAPVAVVELGEGLTRVDLRGTAVEEFLSSVCGVDFHTSVFAPESCVRTRVAGIAAILDRRGPDKFACYVARSYLGYLLAALRESALGFSQGT
jgi:heterotetrameric sarcosine oxidase gamma subunit